MFIFVVECRLSKVYNEEGRFNLVVRMFLNISLVPPQDVYKAFVELVNSDFYDERLYEFVEYFQVKMFKKSFLKVSPFFGSNC